MSWFRIWGTVAIVVVVGVILYGSYQYYFQKPTPIVNNYTVQSGATFNQKQGEKKSQHLLTQVSADLKGTVMVGIGWLW